MDARFVGEVFDEQGVPLGTVGGFYNVTGGPTGKGRVGVMGWILIRPGNREVEETCHYIVKIDDTFYLIYVRKLVEGGWKDGLINDVVRGLPDD